MEEFLSQTARVEEAQNNMLKTTREHSRLVREIASSSVDEGLDSVYETAGEVYGGVDIHISYFLNCFYQCYGLRCSPKS